MNKKKCEAERAEIRSLTRKEQAKRRRKRVELYRLAKKEIVELRMRRRLRLTKKELIKRFMLLDARENEEEIIMRSRELPPFSNWNKKELISLLIGREMIEDWEGPARADTKREARALAIAEAATDDEMFDESDESDESDEDDYSRELAKNRITGKDTSIADMYKRAGVLPGAAFISTSVDESDDEKHPYPEWYNYYDEDGQHTPCYDELRADRDAETRADCMSEQAEAERKKHMIEVRVEDDDESSDCKDC